MRNPFFRIIVAFLLFLSIPGKELKAQATDTTVVDPYDAVEEDTVNYFNTIIEPDKQPVSQRHISGEALQKLRRDKAFWYVNTSPEKPREPKEDSFLKRLLLMRWFSILLWIIIIGGFIGAIIWFLVASDVRLFRKRSKQLHVEEEAIDTDNIYTIDYETELTKAIASENYRLATRLMYLQTLKQLSERGLIQYKQGRTNTEYVMQLHGQTIYDPFFRLTRQFEYAWYGGFEVSSIAFKKVQENFAHLKSAIAA